MSSNANGRLQTERAKHAQMRHVIKARIGQPALPNNWGKSLRYARDAEGEPEKLLYSFRWEMTPSRLTTQNLQIKNRKVPPLL